MENQNDSQVDGIKSGQESTKEMTFVDLKKEDKDRSVQDYEDSSEAVEDTFEIEESNKVFEKPAPMLSFYYILRFSMRMFMKQFFRDISVLGLHNIPKRGPVIFCGNHNNQFVDGVILLTTASRDVRFMVAAKVSTNIDS
jgi:hypothetical protein